MIIKDCRNRYQRCFLKKPYQLAFGKIEYFHVNVIEFVLSDGRIGTGEIVPLPGYGVEDQNIVDNLLHNKPYFSGLTEEEAKSIIDNYFKEFPFTKSGFITAIDLAYGNFSLSDTIEVPLVATVSSSCLNIMNEINDAILSGFKTLKVKIGIIDLFSEIAIAKQLSRFSKDISIRFDANQSYSFEDAEYFIKSVQEDSDKFQLLEQPLISSDWLGFEKLCRISDIPLMLDESIYDFSDIKKAFDTGASLIKLKLCKHNGPNHTIQLARFAVELGLKVVLGNGVSSHIGNIIELSIYSQNRDLFYGASESNGFSKIIDEKLIPFSIIKNGNIYFENKRD